MTALASTHHRHRKPPLHRRALARLRSVRAHRRAETRREEVEASRAAADFIRVKVSYDVRPFLRSLARVRAQLAALDAAQVYVACHPEQGPVVPVTATRGQPPAAVLPDEVDERWPHLNRQWSDSTGSFQKIIGDQS